ncbi:cutinase family protein (plasmid) [Nocardia sp. NBC_01503]|uniref:cutinase family protein n=1 Tax=Nocardia sp. NBC_01503 TaxID=2975997 RepID=UPI002E7C483E|nr:cutinase family protein [Nocardia sp. NBC_01503]WTL36634.1 cutinase family protein [Nocardia sp. NBC_01503]
MSTLRRQLRAGAVATIAAATIAVLLTMPATTAGAQSSDCPALFTLGVQGTGQSSPNASPTDDTGFLSNVFTPLLAKADAEGAKVQREYLPYDASFGGFVAGGTNATYAQSVTKAVDKARTRLSELVSSCKDSAVALVGYSQGAHVISLLAQDIGAGNGPVPVDKIAGVALFGDPTRTAGATTFPGDTNATRPNAMPGTSGQVLGEIAQVNPLPPSGAGIGESTEKPADFGKLVGRVVSFCTGGDLSCDAPDNAPLLRAVAQVAASVQNPGDPIQALANIATSLAQTGIKTVTSVANNDLSGTSLSALSYSPKKSISQRIAEASDPNTPVDISGALKAVMKIGTIALNAVGTVAKSMLTATNIAEIGTAGLANPIAGLALFGAKLAGALSELVPISTGIRWVTEAFQAFITNISDNQDLLSATTWVKYSDVITRHGSYQTDPITPTGQTATTWVADWFAAAAADIAGVQAAPASSTSAPSTTPEAAVPLPATSAAPATTVPVTTAPMTSAPSAAPSSAAPVTTTPKPY